MKLLTKRETDSIFNEFKVTLCEKGVNVDVLTKVNFNHAVNYILYDRRLTNLILKRVKAILAKLDKKEQSI